MQNLDVSKTVDAWSSLADTGFAPHLRSRLGLAWGRP